MRDKRKWLVFLSVAAVLGVAGTLLWQAGPVVSAEEVLALIRRFSNTPAAPLVVVGAYVGFTLLMLPRLVLTVAAGIAFGPWLGFAYALAGMMLATLSTYYIGTLVARRAPQLTGHPAFARCRSVAGAGFAPLMALRFVPGIPFLLHNVASGMFAVPLWLYLAVVVLAESPSLLLSTVFAGHAGSVFSGTAGMTSLSLGLAAAVAIGVGGVVLRRRLAAMSGTQ